MKNKLLIIFHLLLLFNISGLSQSKFEDTKILPKDPRGEVITAFISAYNSFDKKIFSSFIQNEFSQKALNDYTVEIHLQYYTQYQHYHGKYDFECIRAYKGEEKSNILHFLVKSQLFNSFIEFEITYDSLGKKIEDLTFSPFELSAIPSYNASVLQRD